MRLLAGVFLLAAFTVPFLLFGGRVWLSTVLFSAAAAAAAAGAAGMVRGARWHRGVLACGAVLVGLAALQLVPLPHGLVERLSPVRAQLQAAVPVEDLAGWPEAVERRVSLSELLAGEAEPEAAAPSRRPDPYPLSFDPAGTAAAALALAAMLLLLSALAGQPDERLGLAVLGPCLLLLAGGAVYGLWHSRVGGPLYGIFEPPPFDNHRPYGTFWNLNHFAGLCALACPVLLAAALDPARRAWLRLAALLLLAPTASAVLDAGSRGGLLAGGAGAVLLGLALLRSPERRLRMAGAGLAGLAVLGVVLAFTLFSERLIRESFDETTDVGEGSNFQRLELYERQLGMVAAAPLAGHGLGAFHDAHGAYKRSPIPLVPHHGESDWLETAVESGVGGWLAWLALLVLLWRAPLRAAWARRAPPLLLGLLAGSSATVAHAAVDYHHREPPVALVSILLAATAHAWAKAIERGERPPPAGRGPLDLGLVFVSLGLGALLHLPVAPALKFDRGREGALRAFERGEPGQALVLAQQAADALPQDGTGWALLAAAHEKLAQGVRGSGRAAHRREALAASAEALRRSPATLGAARRAGSLLVAVGAEDEALRAAELAVTAAPGHSPSRQLLGEVLLLRGRTAEALPHLAFAYGGVPIARLQEQAPQFTRLLHEASGGDCARVLEVVPATEHRAWYLASLGRSGRADELPACFERLAEEPVPEDARRLVGTLALAPGPESAALAARLLPALEATWPRALAGRALVLGGRPAEGERVLRGLLDEPDAPALAWATLADAAAEAGDGARACRLAEEGLARHPEDSGLSARRERHCGGT